MRLISLAFSFIATMIAMGAVSSAFAYDCPAAPAAMKDIEAQGYYVDKAGSVVDESRKKANEEMVRPLDDYLAQVTGMSDRYLANRDAGVGACTIAWLAEWAQGGAMLGRMVHVNNDQSEYMRQWMHGGIAMAYLKTRDVATEAQRAQIEPWLKALSAATLAYWNNPKKTRNNHFYWTGVGIMATAVATGDKDILRNASGIYVKGIGDILDDGSLPLEMKRGQRALHYHNFALGPLVLMAELARLNGMDWYAYQNNRIDLLAQRVASGYRDSTWFAQQAGIAQEPAKMANGENGWVEFYRLRSSHPELFDDLHRAGPFSNPRMGGDLSLMAQVGIVASQAK